MFFILKALDTSLQSSNKIRMIGYAAFKTFATIFTPIDPNRKKIGLSYYKRGRILGNRKKCQGHPYNV